MNELAAKSRDGTLGADEQLEIESYRQACRLLDLMKAKARLSLKKAGEITNWSAHENSFCFIW